MHQPGAEGAGDTQEWAVGLLTWACTELSLSHRLCTAFSLLSQYIRHQTWLSTCIVVSKSDTICEADGEDEGEGNS